VLVESRNDRGYPRRAAENLDMAEPGYWLMMPFEEWSSAHWAEELVVAYTNPWSEIDEQVAADVTERRDTCKD
jgi:hypothetical protein